MGGEKYNLMLGDDMGVVGWVIFILVGYLCSVGMYILVVYLYLSGPSVFWWAVLFS